MRQFETGSTRDSDENKLDYEGFFSPLVIKQCAEYMHKHRKQADGRLRASDNWQKGIPKDVYMKSLWRHFMDLWLHHRGHLPEATHDIKDALSAIMFNASGYLYELLKREIGSEYYYPHYCHNCFQNWVDTKRVNICPFCKSDNVVNDEDRKNDR